MGMQDPREEQVENWGKNWKKNSFFKGNQGQLFQFCPERTEALLLHILHYSLFYLKCPRKYQKTYNFDIFPTLPQTCTSPPPKFWGES